MAASLDRAELSARVRLNLFPGHLRAAFACLVLTSGPAHADVASFYGSGLHGRLTASGERFNQHALTAAHRTLPLGTQVRVTNRVTGRSVVVRINDRGPFVRGRSIDLSAGAARAIGMADVGVVALSVLR